MGFLEAWGHGVTPRSSSKWPNVPAGSHRSYISDGGEGRTDPMGHIFAESAIVMIRDHGFVWFVECLVSLSSER